MVAKRFEDPENYDRTEIFALIARQGDVYFVLCLNNQFD